MSLPMTEQTPASRLQGLQSMLRTDPRNPFLRQQCTELALSSRDYDGLIATADIVLAAQPEDTPAQFDRATGLIGKREYAQALEVLHALRPLQPETYGIDFNIALCHYCLNEYEAALPHLRECFSKGLRDAGLLRLLVTTYHHLGMMEEAAQLCIDNPDPAATDAALAGAYALVLLDVDDSARAARWAGIALRLNPKSIDGRVVQAILLATRLRTEEARAMLESVVADAPQSARAWIGLGSLAMLSQDLASARSLLMRGVELMPGHVGSWHALGWTQFLQNDLQAAQATFEHAMELDRNFAETHGALASIAATQGERESAERLIDVALRLDPDCMSARFAQSVLARRAGDAVQAQAIMDAAAAALGAQQKNSLGQSLSKLLQRAKRS
jgi:tetratricopeptide (TPR) repeat protein